MGTDTTEDLCGALGGWLVLTGCIAGMTIRQDCSEKKPCAVAWWAGDLAQVMAEQPAAATDAVDAAVSAASPTRIVKVDPATKDEVEAFITENNRWIEDAAATEFRNMSPEDQRRVISAGTLVSCRDAAGVMRSRVRQAREKEAILSGAHLTEAARDPWWDSHDAPAE
eukprot:s581_g5.t1